MAPTIHCVPKGNGYHDFYLKKDQICYYLFSQKYRKGVQNYYGRGVRLNEAMDYTRSNRNSAVTRTMEKLPKYIRYIEKEYRVTVLDRTRQKGQNVHK